MVETISFRVVKEPYGWAVRSESGMMAPFRSRASAVEHANGVAEALRRCGEAVEVVLEDRVFDEPSPPRRGRSRFPTIWS